MSELSTNRLWDTGTETTPSQYSRMIPGTPAMPSPRFSPRKQKKTPASSLRPAMDPAHGKNSAVSGSTQRATKLSAAERLEFESLATDCVILAATIGSTALLLPGLVPWTVLPVFITLVTLLGFSEGIYAQGGDPAPAGTVPALARSTFFASFLLYVAELSFMAAIAIFSGSLLSLIFSRVLRHWLWNKDAQKTKTRNVLIIGGGMIARSLAQALRADPLRQTNVCGFLDDDLPLSPAVLGRITDLDWLARSQFVDEVILALPGQPAQTRMAAELAFRNHLDILAVSDLPPGPWPGSSIDRIGEIGVITLHRESLPSGALTLKRFLDVVGSVFGLVTLSPIMAMIALLIRLDSAGSAIYSAERTGAKGRKFRCHKFRSMVTNADLLKQGLRERNQRSGPIFKIDNDPRMTRVGRFIRRYSVDELPQLWNVLKGEMSLVGPRPHPVDEVNHYELQHYRRLDVKPGITGLWQISARDCPSFELNMHLDLTYIENWTLLLDLRILAKTVRVLFAPEGA